MDEIALLISKRYRSLAEEREREIAFYRDFDVRTLEGRGRHCKLVDVTDETISRLPTEIAWYRNLEQRALSGTR